MPNWCENAARIGAPTEQDAIAFERELLAGNLFNSYLPVALDGGADAQSPGLPFWYAERSRLWGVKWDVDPTEATIARNGREIECSFLTAWVPPLPFYRHLLSLRYEVDVSFFEGGMLFGGRLSGDGIQRWEYDGGVLTPESIPEYLHAAFGSNAFDWLFEDHDEAE